jgi:tetratricopeptide (TPR) repeat protein
MALPAAAAGEGDRVSGEWLAAYSLELAEQAKRGLAGPERAEWLDRLEREHDGLRTALRWMVKHGEAEPGLRLMIALRDFWRWHLREGREWFAQVLALPQASARTALRARALDNAATLAFYELYQRDDPVSEEFRGEYVACRALTEESLAIFRELDAKWEIANVLVHKAIGVRLLEGDYPQARALFEESLTIWRELGDSQAVSWVLVNLACVAIDVGDYGAARSLVEESESLAPVEGWITGLLDSAARRAARDGQPERALRLGGAADAQRKAWSIPAFLQARLEQVLKPAREALDPVAQEAAWEEGRAMTLEQATAYALEEPFVPGRFKAQSRNTQP